MNRHRYWSPLIAAGLLFAGLVPGQGARAEHGDASPDTAQLCSVTRITDGDTIDVDCDGARYTLRLQCIDAPERDQEPWGARAMQQLEQMLGRQVGVYGHERDQYDRVVSTIYDPRSLDNLNVEMVRSGAAAIYERYCSTRAHYTDYYEARGEARNNKRGIWKRPGLHQTPWEYRRSE